MIAPALSMNVVNKLIKKACASNKEKKYFQLKWNKFSSTYETRWFFQKSYQKTFVALNACIKYKINNPPEIRMFLVEPCIQSDATKKWFHKETTAEFDAFSEKLSWGLRYEFPEKTKIYEQYDEETYKYTYIYFEDGRSGYNCAFIEENSCQDSLLGDYYTPMFHRAYVSVNGNIFPFFKEPQWERKSYPWNEETQDYEKPSIEYYCIYYLNKQRGMRVKPDGYRDYSFKYFDEEKQEWLYESFTQHERRILVPYCESSDDDYYSD